MSLFYLLYSGAIFNLLLPLSNKYSLIADFCAPEPHIGTIFAHAYLLLARQADVLKPPRAVSRGALGPQRDSTGCL